MRESLAQALTLAHDNLRFGVPHFRERPLIPIRTPVYLLVFDPERLSPLYTMLAIQLRLQTEVQQTDNLTSGDVSLQDELSTTEKHYANWNRANPSFPIDKSDTTGGQYRRGDMATRTRASRGQQPAESRQGASLRPRSAQGLSPSSSCPRGDRSPPWPRPAGRRPAKKLAAFQQGWVGPPREAPPGVEQVVADGTVPAPPQSAALLGNRWVSVTKTTALTPTPAMASAPWNQSGWLNLT